MKAVPSSLLWRKCPYSYLRSIPSFIDIQDLIYLCLLKTVLKLYCYVILFLLCIFSKSLCCFLILPFLKNRIMILCFPIAVAPFVCSPPGKILWKSRFTHSLFFLSSPILLSTLSKWAFTSTTPLKCIKFIVAIFHKLHHSLLNM